MSHLLILLAAIGLDRVVGDPPWLWQRMPHPVVLFGKAIDLFEEPLNRTPACRRHAGGDVRDVLPGDARLASEQNDIVVVGGCRGGWVCRAGLGFRASHWPALNRAHLLVNDHQGSGTPRRNSMWRSSRNDEDFACMNFCK